MENIDDNDVRKLGSKLEEEDKIAQIEKQFQAYTSKWRSPNQEYLILFWVVYF